MEIGGNFWVLVGNSQFCQKQWGITRNNFPVAYLIPKPAVTRHERILRAPDFVKDICVFAGIAIEISDQCKDIPLNRANEFIAGCRIWIGLHSKHLVDTLTGLGHQIRVRDHGISLYYGQWFERFHALGNLLQSRLIEEYCETPLILKSTYEHIVEKNLSDYTNSVSKIVAFLSRFMTLNKGDIFALGALCGFGIEKENSQISALWADNVLDITIENYSIDER